MKWIKKDIYGNLQTWYSGDVISQIREWATADILGRKYGAEGKYDACETILNFLNEIDE